MRYLEVFDLKEMKWAKNYLEIFMSQKWNEMICHEPKMKWNDVYMIVSNIYIVALINEWEKGEHNPKCIHIYN